MDETKETIECKYCNVIIYKSELSLHINSITHFNNVQKKATPEEKLFICMSRLTDHFMELKNKSK